MTALCSHQDGLHELAGVSRSPIALSSWQRYANWLGASVRRAIGRIGAVLRRHDDWSFEPAAYRSRDPDSDATRFPQRPLILGDMWDF
jgi:hypothetical protein